VQVTRRDVLKGGAAAGVAAASGVLPDALRRVLAAPPQPGKLSDIEHVVFLIQENHSFDHYFGAYHGARGFNEYDHASPVWNQAYTAQDFAASGATPSTAPPNPLRPFRLADPTSGSRWSCTHDIDHQWVNQHKSWNLGAMDKFLTTHIGYDQYTQLGGPFPGNPNPKYANGPLTMGYHVRGDLPFYYALADNFTLCDNYFTSTITGSAANWIYAMTGMIDPDAKYGGPVLSTPTTTQVSDYVTKYYGHMSWTTMPERLEAKGITWKYYNSPDLTNPDFNDNFMLFFQQFITNPTLAQKCFGDTNWQGPVPTSFMLDCQNGTLPQVSWLIAPELWSEHPPTPSGWGQDMMSHVVSALASSPLWSKTALFVTWDDSGGWFDHVAPVTAPPGTPGEYLSSSLTDAQLAALNGPAPWGRQAIGLGFRVPMIIVSPFTRNPDPATGPMISSDRFDHTSMLRFLETLFCVEAPNLTAWRRATVGDMTSAFNFAGGAQAFDASVLPGTDETDATRAECLNAVTETEGNHGTFPYPVGTSIPAPVQEALPAGGRVKRPSGQVVAAGCVAPAGKVTTSSGGSSGGSPNTGAARDLLPATLEVAGGAALLAGAWWARRRDGGQPEDEA